MNYENKNELGTTATIGDIPIESSKIRCDDTWKRKCPKCSCELGYTLKNNWMAANKLGSLCRKCRVISDITKEKHRIAKLGKTGTPRTEQVKVRLREWYNSHMTEEMSRRRDTWKHNMSDELKDKFRKNRMGKTASETTREKLRNIKLNKVSEMGGFPSYNKTACDFMDRCGLKYGYAFRHALNGGEKTICGYSVDGYDEDRNTIFEYDERRHENFTRKMKDMKRTEDIMRKVDCEIIRYSERFDRLYKSYPTHSTPIHI